MLVVVVVVLCLVGTVEFVVGSLRWVLGFSECVHPSAEQVVVMVLCASRVFCHARGRRGHPLDRAVVSDSPTDWMNFFLLALLLVVSSGEVCDGYFVLATTGELGPRLQQPTRERKGLWVLSSLSLVGISQSILERVSARPWRIVAPVPCQCWERWVRCCNVLHCCTRQNVSSWILSMQRELKW